MTKVLPEERIKDLRVECKLKGRELCPSARFDAFGTQREIHGKLRHRHGGGNNG